MKTLLLMRHAKSSWKDSDRPDFDRPLNPRGRRNAPRMGKLLIDEDLIPDQIISSPARRARKTAAGVADACGYPGVIELHEDLYASGADDYVQVLRNLYYNEDRVLLIGHNPVLEEFLTRLTGARQALPTAAIAEIAIPIDDWRHLDLTTQAELVNLWKPRELE